MAKDEEVELTQEEALERANAALEQGPLAQMGIKLQTPDEIRARMLGRLLDATTVEEVLGGNDPDGWGQHENRSIIIRDVSYSPSTKKGGLGFYVIVNAIDAHSNEPLLLTSGSENVVLAVAKLAQKGWLDVPVKLVTATSGEGNTVHRLTKGDAGDAVPY